MDLLRTLNRMIVRHQLQGGARYAANELETIGYAPEAARYFTEFNRDLVALGASNPTFARRMARGEEISPEELDREHQTLSREFVQFLDRQQSRFNRLSPCEQEQVQQIYSDLLQHGSVNPPNTACKIKSSVNPADFPNFNPGSPTAEHFALTPTLAPASALVNAPSIQI